MAEGFFEQVEEKAIHLSGACEMSCIVYDLLDQPHQNRVPFCNGCELNRSERCNPSNVHHFSVSEALRWSGLYIYDCALGMAFIATTVQTDVQPRYTMISGPLLMARRTDLFASVSPEIENLIEMTPKRVTHIAHIQWTLCQALSGKDMRQAQKSGDAQKRTFNTLYDVAEQIRDAGRLRHPLDIERRLQSMIASGDKQGAQELINQLLGHVYFHSQGDFGIIKTRAAELVVLLSRASIEGGADAGEIFGINTDMIARIQSFKSMDELSMFLTDIFHRFVGLVFDVREVKHVEVIRKAIEFIRQNYGQRISLNAVAKHVHLSRSYICKVFKEEMHCTLTAYINLVRVEKSKALLLDPTIPLAEVANLVGFDDQSYFTRVFRRLENGSPGRYRQSGGRLELRRKDRFQDDSKD